MIDLSPHHLETVKRILAEHVPDCEVRAFGSRATWTAWEYSDLDLAVVSHEPLDRRTSANLREALEESDLPIRVDVVDWATLTDGFRQAIEGDCVVVQQSAVSAGWREVSLGDCTTLTKGLSYKSAFLNGDGPDLIGLGQFTPGGGAKLGDRRTYSGEYRDKDVARPGDVLIAMTDLTQRGAVLGSPLAVPPSVGDFCLYTLDAGKLAPHNGVDPQFLYYTLRNADFRAFAAAHATGTTVRRVRPADVLAYEFPLPPLEEQRRIAGILGALDDKIELNQRMIESLEAMARALFNSWFVDFDPVRAKIEGRPTGLPPEIDALFPDSFRDSELGEIPDGWGVGSIADVCTRIENGGTPRRLEPRFWGGSINWFKTAELSDSPLLASGEHITDEGLSNSSCKLWPRGTVLIALYASPTVGRLGILEVPASANQACSALQADPAFGEQILFYTLLEARDHLQNIAVGAAQQNISQRIVRDLPIIMSPSELAQVFQDTVQAQYDQRIAKLVESRALAETRDALIGELLTT